jgi:hypothetical protein
MSTFHYAYARWATERFPLPTEEQVANLEWRLKTELPGDYREFLLSFNGGVFDAPEIICPDPGCPRRGLQIMYGVDSPHEATELGRDWHLALFDDNDPIQILPIGRTSSGDLIILSVAGEDRGVIYFKQASGGWFELAEGIEEFFANLRESDWGEG